MKKLIFIVNLIIAAGLLVGSAYAGPTDDPRIQKREQNQERRIDQGVRSSELTPRETGRLEAEQAKIKQTEEKMKSDGKLTAKERKRLNRMQNKASKDIYRLKHNERRSSVQ